jgi:AraC-like DNA-binding protein
MIPGQGTGLIERFNAVRGGGRRGLDRWNTILGQTWNGLVVSPADDDYTASLQRWSIDDIAFARPVSAGCQVRRRGESRPDPAGLRLALHFVEKGHGCLFYGNRWVELAPGDAVLCEADYEYRFDFSRDHQLSIIECPRDSLDLDCAVIDSCVGARIGLGQRPQRIVRSFVQTLWQEATTSCEPQSLDLYRPVLLDLLRMMLTDHAQAAGAVAPPPSISIVPAMDRLIDLHLADPDLCPSLLATELGMSLRALQSGCVPLGVTPRERILAKRMEFAARRLSEDRCIKIASIAFDCGFHDSAHFSRRFTGYFGVSPAQFRRQA